MRLEIDEAARCLAAGGLVAFPTETVYGLGADAANAEAVAAIYRIKGRPAGHPLIVHVLDQAQAQWWAELGADAQRLIDVFWPGPLTLIVRRRAQAPAHACGDEPSIGLRSPAHPVARALLASFAALGGHGVAAPSANRFGRISPTEAAHVAEDLGDAPVTILDGGRCEVGLESTIVDLTRKRPALLRPGAIDAGRIDLALGGGARVAGASSGDGAPRAPGTLAAHYAPRTPLELVATAHFERRVDELAKAGKSLAVMSATPPRATVARWEPASGDAREYARRLYRSLRALDAVGADRILVESVESAGPWIAVADRLARAQATFEEMP